MLIPKIPLTPRRRQRNNDTKFKRMKQRLRMKVPREALGEQPSEAVKSSPPLEGLQPLAVEKPDAECQPTLKLKQDGDDNDAANKSIDVKTKDKANLFNRSSPIKVVSVCNGMTVDQRALVNAVDFRAMLGMKCSKLNPELCRFLMGCFDPVACVLDFEEREKIPVSVKKVSEVMAVPTGVHAVPYQPNIEATSAVLEILGITDGKQPTLFFVEKQLGPTYHADAAFLRKFFIYLVSSVFASNTGIHVSTKCYPAVLNVEAIPRYNWARFIFDILVQTANAKGTKDWFKACMPFLMVLYVDSLETDAVNVPRDGPCIFAWTNKMIKTVVDLDTKSDGSFGNLSINYWLPTFSIFVFPFNYFLL